MIQSDLVPRAVVNEFVAGFDRVLALGIRFSENGSRGYGLEFLPGQLIQFPGHFPHRYTNRSQGTLVQAFSVVVMAMK